MPREGAVPCYSREQSTQGTWFDRSHDRGASSTFGEGQTIFDGMGVLTEEFPDVVGIPTVVFTVFFRCIPTMVMRLCSCRDFFFMFFFFGYILFG